MPHPSPSSDLINTTLDDRYLVEKLVGQGGMGEVYLARQLRLNRPVAIKVPKPGVWGDPAFRRRFTREAHSMARVQHENICQIFDVYVSEDPEQLSYLVLEYVEGERLDRWIMNNLGTLTIGRLVDILAAIARALDTAHSFNIIHRDIKPSNILMTREGMPKIMDFGVAQAPDDLYATRAGQAIGTPAFMAPEQVRGKNVGPPADQYAFAMSIYKVFTGTIAFKAERSEQLVYMQMNEPPTPPSEHNPNLPFPIELIILKGLAKNPEDRFSSCSQMVDMMRMVLDQHADMPAYTMFPEAENFGTERLDVGSKFDDLFESNEWYHRYWHLLLAGGAMALVVVFTVLLWQLARVVQEGEAVAAPPDASQSTNAPTDTPALRDPALRATQPWGASDATPTPRPTPRPRRTPPPDDSPRRPRPTPTATPEPAPTAAPAAPTPSPTPLVLATPTPFGVFDPNLLPPDDLLALDAFVTRDSVREFIERDLVRIVELKNREELRRRLLVLPGPRREELLGIFDRFTRRYRTLRCTLTLRDDFRVTTQRVEGSIDVLIAGVPEAATSGALPERLYASRAPLPVVLESRGGDWYFVRFPDFLTPLDSPQP